MPDNCRHQAVHGRRSRRIAADRASARGRATACAISSLP